MQKLNVHRAKINVIFPTRMHFLIDFDLYVDLNVPALRFDQSQTWLYKLCPCISVVPSLKLWLIFEIEL